MAKGGKVSSKRRVKPRIRSDYKGSDDSDEDYVVSDEEKLASEDLEEEYCSSLEASDEEEEEEDVKWARNNSRSRGKKSVDRFIVDEEDEEELNIGRKKGRSGAKKGSDRFVVDEEEEEELEDEEEVEDEIRRVRKNGRSRVRKGKDRSNVDEVEDEEEEGGEEEEAMKETRNAAGSKSQNSLSDRQKKGVNQSEKRRRTKTEEMADQDYEEEEEVEEEEEDDAEYDEEFTPDEDECSDLEEESRPKKRKTNLKVSKRPSKKKGPIRRKSKKPSRKKQKKTGMLRRKVRSDDDDDDDGDFMESCPPVRKKKEKKRPKKRRRYVAPSDSDPVSSGTSDRDFTISEEEREQVREAMLLCGTIEPDSGSSLPSEKIQDNEIVQPPRKPHGRKGKEKIEQVKVEVVKQVCGICLSEEDKRRVKGTLDCCTHYFCFSCINEWGKVESRCPLCKQRFKTISKLTRAGTELREVSFPVPERDQVYQPTEEELRSYLDPYESVICTECREGGDDGLMLLCDLCDSPAHTYCVGLGHEVPEGNWYCEGCKHVALGSSSSQVQSWFTEQRTAINMPNRHSPAVSFGEGLEIDLNLLSSPRSYATQGFGISSSPLYHAGGFQAVSPGSGAGAPTLSVRRLRHRQIHQLISASRMNNLASRNERNSSANLSTDTSIAETAEGRETIVQQTRTDGTFHTFFEERLQESPLLQMLENNVFSSTSHPRRQVVQDSTTTSADRPSNGTLWPGLTENTISSHVLTHHFSSMPDIGLDGYVSPHVVTGPSDIHREKEQLQTLVRSYLKELSRENLGQSATGFQEIARTAIQTILAACEQEHLGSDVIPVQPPSPCSHIELMAGKASMMRGCCSSCFAQFVEGVVKLVMEQKQASWLTLGLCSS